MNKKKDKKPNIKKRILTVVFIAFNVGILFWIALSEFGDTGSHADLSSVHINGWLLIPAALLFIVGFGSECFKYALMTKKLGRQPDWRVGVRTTMLGRYYDNITPAAVGGQPFQIHYMYTHGVKDGYAAMIPVIGLMSTQLGFLIVAFFTFVLFGYTIDPVVMGTGLLGLIFYALLPVAVLVATFNPKLVKKIVSWGVALLAKVHIVKDRATAEAKTEASIEQYTNCVKKIIKNKKLTIIILALSVVFHISITALPFFILKAFGGEINFFACFATVLAITSSIYIIPTPGNAGAAESVFFLVFKSLTTGYVFWAVLFWRFFTYYIYIILGLIIYAFIAYEKKTGREFTDDVWLAIKNIFHKIKSKISPPVKSSKN